MTFCWCTPCRLLAVLRRLSLRQREQVSLFLAGLETEALSVAVHELRRQIGLELRALERVVASSG